MDESEWTEEDERLLRSYRSQGKMFARRDLALEYRYLATRILREEYHLSPVVREKLTDLANSADPDEWITNSIARLNKNLGILDDLPWIEGNLRPSRRPLRRFWRDKRRGGRFEANRRLPDRPGWKRFSGV